jgi:hypothetical protein
MSTNETAIRVPAELKDMVPAINAFLSEMQAQITRAGAGKSMDYSKVEASMAHAAGEIERVGHGVILSYLNSEAKKIKLRGVIWVLVAAGVLMEYKTRSGPVVVARSLYREEGVRNGPTSDPVSVRAGVVGDGWLPGVAKEMAYEIQRGPSREAARTARAHFILPYSRASFERIGHAVGEQYLRRQASIEDEIMENFSIPDAAVGISISIDRASVPMEEPAPKSPNPANLGKDGPKITRAFRMGYCGSVCYFDQGGEMVHATRFAQMPGDDAPAGLVALMRAEVRIALQRERGLALHRVGDGAPEIWNLLDEVTGGLDKAPYDVIDFCHVTGKIGAAAKVVYGDVDGSARMDRWAPMLKGVPNAIESIHDEIMLSGSPGVTESEGAVYDALTYIQRNSDRMNYPEAIAKGFPIGSGIVESTVKSLIEGRMKRPGARWKIRTGDHVLQMRALAQSDRWDDAVDLALKPLRESIRVVQN